MDMVGIVFSDIYSRGLDDLTRMRTVASIPFGGRYRLIDFTLSNLVNVGITAVGVLTSSNYRSLMDHLGSCQEWDLNRKQGGLTFLPPNVSGQTVEYRGKLDELQAALAYLERRKEEYVLLGDTATVCSIDFQPMLVAHMASGCDVTVLAARADRDAQEPSELVLERCADGSVASVSVDSMARAGMYEGLGKYLLSRELLIQTIEDCRARGMHHFERDFLQSGVNRGKLKLGLYEFTGTALRNTSVAAYFENSMRLLDKGVMDSLFRPEAPVYTKVRDEIPSYYGGNAQLSNCLVADGCTVFGKVERSILFRAVYIEKGAYVKNAVIMQGSRIGEGAILENVILDKGVSVGPYIHLCSSERHPIILQKGETV